MFVSKQLIAASFLGLMIPSAGLVAGEVFPGSESAMGTSCKLFQLSGVAEDGSSCRVNVSFGRRAGLGGSSNTICVPSDVYRGNLFVEGTGAFENFISVQTPRPVLSKVEDVAEDFRSIPSYDEVTREFKVTTVVDLYEVSRVTRYAGGGGSYFLGDLFASDIFVSSASCFLD